MRAAIYARYSSENQRKESIDDQVGACRRLARDRGITILEDHIYADEAQSGARKDRPALAQLVAAASSGEFDALLVDDLSRLARDNYLMLSVMAEFHFEGIRVVSVADGLDSNDEEATLGIQIRGIFNELQLRDLKKKTLRGQIGQKERGFFVGERTFGYRSVPVGEMRMDKKGRPRPEGYRMEIEPGEAATVLRIYKAYADGQSLTAIVRTLNEEGVPGRYKTAKGWSPATVSRILDNEKYIGRWTWNRTETRRDPCTGKRRRVEKPESEWVVREDERLRIVPLELWEAVRAKRKERKRTWPGGKGRRGFAAGQGSRQAHFPTHLLSGTMVCGACGGTIAQVSGKSGGYYGCLAAAKGACENKMLVRRKLTEEIIPGAVRDRISDPEQIRHVLKQVEGEIKKLRSDVPETRAKVFRAPPVEWIEHRIGKLRKVLEQRTGRSALILRELLGPIRLEPVPVDVGRPYYRAVTSIDALALIETPPEGGPAEGGSTALRKWTRSRRIRTGAPLDVGPCSSKPHRLAGRRRGAVMDRG